jgi:hypothetical protein
MSELAHLFLMKAVAGSLLAAAAFTVQAQDCPKIDVEAQKAKESECRAAGGQWAKFGVVDFLCNVDSCAPRTADGGKACRNKLDCEHLCVSRREAPVGTPVTGECTAYRTSFGCATHVDGGHVVGRVCVE